MNWWILARGRTSATRPHAGPPLRPGPRADRAAAHRASGRPVEPLEARTLLADGTITFNEVLYPPRPPAGVDEGALEWVELHIQMAVDTDLSGWRLRGGVDFDFPAGTVLPGRGYVVVAFDPAALQAATGY